MNRTLLRGALLLFVLMGSSRVHAQAPTEAPVSPSNGSSSGVWVSLALGAGGAVKDGGGVLAGLNLQILQGTRLWHLRADDLATSFEGDVAQYAVLLGHASSDSTSHFRSAAVGLAFVHRVQCESGCGLLSDAQLVTHTSNTAGVTFVGEMALHHGKRKGVGIGLEAVANINPEASFAAIGFTFSAGRWR